MIELRGHTRPVVALAYSPDGRTLASASHDGTARLWDVFRGAEVARLQSASDRATAIAFAADGSELAVGFARPHGLVQRYALPSVAALDAWAAHPRTVRALAYRPGSATLATTGDGTIMLWAIDQSYPSHRLLGPRGLSTDGLAFSPDGSLLAAMTSGPATLRIYDVGRRRSLKTYQFGSTWGYRVAFAPGGDRVAYGLEDDIGEWDVMPKKVPPARWEAHAGAVLGITYLPDGSGLLTCGSDGLVKSWDAAGNLRRSYDWRVGELYALAVAPDGLTAAAGGPEAIVVWDVS